MRFWQKSSNEIVGVKTKCCSLALGSMYYVHFLCTISPRFCTYILFYHDKHLQNNKNPCKVVLIWVLPIKHFLISIMTIIKFPFYSINWFDIKVWSGFTLTFQIRLYFVIFVGQLVYSYCNMHSCKFQSLIPSIVPFFTYFVTLTYEIAWKWQSHNKF